MYDGEGNPRPAKRQKIDTQSSPKPQKLSQLTLANLLLSLPSLLLHPPTHTNHERSLALSYHALKTCNTMTSLDKTVECRAATGLAELGLLIGLSSPGIQDEIQKAITKALLIAHNLPSLYFYRHRLTQLSSQLSLISGNPKVAQNNLKRALTTFTSNDPPNVVYTIHLALIASISAQSSGETTNIVRSLGAISDLCELASKRGHQSIVQLASVLRLRALMRAGLWSDVGESLDAAENALGMRDVLDNYAQDKGKAPENQDQTTAVLPSPPSSSSSARSILEYALIAHTLMLGIIFHTYTGDASLTNPRLRWLHELLDMHLPRFPKTGTFEIPFPNAPPLYYQLTHPRLIYILGFLVSSLAKRDLVGRKPKKKIFASEGIIAIDKELKKELAYPAWASISEVKNVDYRLKKMRADLMCELISAAIMRSEFDEAERSIDETISYTRTQGIFSFYIARITLYEAQLAHALNKSKRALQCYQVAAWLSRKREQHELHSSPFLGSRGNGSTFTNASSNINPEFMDGEEDRWINTAARAGELWLRIGLLRQTSPTEMSEDEKEREMETLRKVGEGVTKDCRGLGGTLDAIAEVLDSCLTKEFVKAKTHLRRALNLSTASQDNHLRALVLSLIASHYLHTSNQHAEKMLETAESLAAGLGAQSKHPKAQDQSPAQGGVPTSAGMHDVVGNAHLRLWIGERFLELYNRSGNKEVAKVQVIKNRRFQEAVARVEARM